MKESQFQSELTAQFERTGFIVLNVHGHAMQKSGWPDLYVTGVPWTGWLELKVGARRASEAQEGVLAALRLRGVGGFVLRLREGLGGRGPGCDRGGVPVYQIEKAGAVIDSGIWDKSDLALWRVLISKLVVCTGKLEAKQ